MTRGRAPTCFSGDGCLTIAEGLQRLFQPRKIGVNVRNDVMDHVMSPAFF